MAIINIFAAAKKAGVTDSTIRRAIRLKRIKAFKVGRKQFVEESEVNRWCKDYKNK